VYAALFWQSSSGNGLAGEGFGASLTGRILGGLLFRGSFMRSVLGASIGALLCVWMDRQRELWCCPWFFFSGIRVPFICPLHTKWYVL
jgi:hypothetical protein